ncbi:LysE family translocator [Sphaerotilus montanus]|uniref:LysE family translocator n=1 Tax=Sphaerotilus montanus TaxID=522889 RepID=UPI003FA27A35
MPALGLHDLPLFALTVLVLNATPGVDLVFTVSRTLQHGVRTGLAGAAGISAGCVVHALGAAFGLAALLAVSTTAFTVLKGLGAAYLVWLAVGMLRSALATPAAHTADVVAEAPVPQWRVFRQGLLTNVLNPKVALFFLAFLPQFIDADAPHKTLAFLALGGWFVLQSALFLIALVLLTARLRHLGRGSATTGRWLNGLGGVLFLGLAARLARTDLP